MSDTTSALPGARVALCRFDALEDPGCKGFDVGDVDGLTCDLFVVRKGDAVFAYVNDCPHYRTTLEWRRDCFLSHDKAVIQCSLHGARFRIEDGYCEWGPCEGFGLVPIKAGIEDGMVVIETPDPETLPK